MFEYIADLITFNLLRLEPTSQLAESVHFFIYDVLKIAISILIVITIRIRNEKKNLKNTLPGYTEYMKKVKYRLLPFVW